jgi:ATP-binding cassette subfamily B protein
MIVNVLVGTAWRAARRTVVAAFVTTTLAAIGSAAFPIGFHLMVDGALARDSSQVIVGTVEIVVLFTLSWTLGTMAVGRNSVLTDRINSYLSARIGYLVNAAPRLAHLEDPELLREIDQLRDRRRTLAAAVRLLLRGWTVVIRGGTIMVLLATVYPPVMIVPLLGLIPAFADRRAARTQQRTDDELATDRRLLGDLFTLATTAGTAKELRTYGVTGALAARHAELAERVRRQAVRGTVRGALWEAAGWLGYAVAFVGVILVLVLRAAHGETSPGEVVMAVSLMRRAQVQISNASDTVGSLATALRTARRLRDLEEYVAAETARTGEAQVPARLAEGIALRDVEFSYPRTAEPVLHGVDLELPAGSVVAVVGDNGAGKTTLVKLLTGMYRPDAGRILVDGVDLADLDPAAWRLRTTAVFQDFLRPFLLLREAVGIGDLPRIDDTERVEAAMAAAGAKPPVGLETPLGRSVTGGRELSGGQWQRLALARGLMRETPLLTVLDEPTASLDAAAETRLFAKFAELSRSNAESGGITILVSHRFSTVRMADVIVVLSGGRVAEAGSHDELLAAGGTYAQLFDLQARAYR